MMWYLKCFWVCYFEFIVEKKPTETDTGVHYSFYLFKIAFLRTRIKHKNICYTLKKKKNLVKSFILWNKNLETIKRTIPLKKCQITIAFSYCVSVLKVNLINLYRADVEILCRGVSGLITYWGVELNTQIWIRQRN